MNWTPPKVVVRPSESVCLGEATKLARLAKLPVVTSDEPAHCTDRGDANPWVLLVKPAALSLVRPDGLSIEIDFIQGKGLKRSQEANFRSQPLARALGVQKFRKRYNQHPEVIDATAGFGTDGWMMASLGCDVRLVESSPVVATMLSHALATARVAAPDEASKHASGAISMANPAHTLSVINADSVEYLNNGNNAGADVIYLDPMYPQTRSKALVKKGMQLLHELIGPDTNGSALLSAALKRAEYRVVVKRPSGAPQLEGSETFSGQITDVQSPHTRFDIYHLGGR